MFDYWSWRNVLRHVALIVRHVGEVYCRNSRIEAQTLCRVMDGTRNCHLDRELFRAPRGAQGSLASSTRGAQRSNMGGAFGHDTDRWGFHDCSAQQKGADLFEQKHQGPGADSFFVAVISILACQSSIEYLPWLCVQTREWSHRRGAVRLRSVPQRSCPNMYIASYLTRLRHRAGVLLRR